MQDAPSPATPLAPPERGVAAAGRDQRRLRNYLLDGPLQLRLAGYLLAVAVALSAGLGYLLWGAYRETSRVIALADPEAVGPLAQALAREDRIRMVAVAAALVAALLCLLVAAVVVTHRIAGPAYAIARTCRRVAAGDLTPPPPLRAHDLLLCLGRDAAAMVEALRIREGQELTVAHAAVATLRDPGAGPAERARAADALERLAREKEGRLRPAAAGRTPAGGVA